MVLSFDYFI